MSISGPGAPRRRLGALASLLVAASLAWIGPAAARAPATPPPAWPQAVSDVPADPSFIFGVLPNGMRYAVRRQAVPPGQAALRLHISAGSLNETDGQQGLAHFVEHMAFNGSTHVPEGEMVKILERLGLAFGADTNASTGFEETIYKLDLPKTDRETLDTSLMLLRETAGELTFSPAAVDRERGVVLSEERSGDGPGMRAARAGSEFQFPGQLPPRRFPIGEVEVLKSVDAARLRAFYQAWYRPELAVLVAVGDFDPQQVEARIRETFSDWKAVGPAGVAPPLGKLARRSPETKVFVDPGLPNALVATWIAEPELAPDTLARRRINLERALVAAILNRRLSDLGRGEKPPFLGAGASIGEPYRAQKTAGIYALASGGDWRKAMTAILEEQRRLEKFGVREDEVQRVITDTRSALTAARAGSGTRTPSALADPVVGSISIRDVVTSPEQDFEVFEREAKTLSAAGLSRTAATLFSGSGPIVFMTSPKPIEGGEAAVTAAAQDALKARVTASETQTLEAWPYPTFGTPSGLAERRDVADIDAVFLRFNNGVRLTVKPTKFKTDQILVRVNFGDGRLGLDPARPSPEWATGAMMEGGLGKLPVKDMERTLSGRIYSAGLGMSDDTYVLSGGTRGEDLELQLQVLAAFLSDPGWRLEAFGRYSALSATVHDQLASTGAGVLGRDLGALLRSGDRRWAFPAREELAATRLDDLKAAISSSLASGPIEVVIVGDITVEKAVDAVDRTFGALPARPGPKSPPADRVKVQLPQGGGQPVVRTHKGRADQAVLFTAWPTTDFFADPRGARANRLLAAILNLRLTDELREKQGSTYSPSADSTESLMLPGWGYVSTVVETPPDKIEAVTRDIERIAAELTAAPPTADEMTRARKPVLEGLQQSRETNGYWLSILSGMQADPRQLDAYRSAIPTLERLTPADIQAAARKWLRPDRIWRMEVRPETAAAAKAP